MCIHRLICSHGKITESCWKLEEEQRCCPRAKDYGAKQRSRRQVVQRNCGRGGWRKSLTGLTGDEKKGGVKISRRRQRELDGQREAWLWFVARSEVKHFTVKHKLAEQRWNNCSYPSFSAEMKSLLCSSHPSHYFFYPLIPHHLLLSPYSVTIPPAVDSRQRTASSPINYREQAQTERERDLGP